ncbi:MAG TPA: DUF6636 domain-containing protein [Gaiellaceae bacterium]|nr:DUF6636 domain-containing protein [Gaiellaceae bacterium]
MRRLLLCGLAVAVLAPLQASARTATIYSFRTPSKNIYCQYAAGLGSPPFLRCDIQSGLHHPTPGTHHCVEGVYGQSVGMTKTGPAAVLCISDSTINPAAHVLGYGQSWSFNGFRCASRSSGLTCANARGHGFFLSRQTWRVH